MADLTVEQRVAQVSSHVAITPPTIAGTVHDMEPSDNTTRPFTLPTTIVREIVLQLLADSVVVLELRPT